jgi:toxin ParE1/3/4
VTVVWTPRALNHLAQIEAWIGRDDADRAASWVEALIARGDSLASMPMRGAVLPELPDGPWRQVLHGNYRIVYRVFESGKVSILAVFEGHRLLRADDIDI